MVHILFCWLCVGEMLCEMLCVYVRTIEREPSASVVGVQIPARTTGTGTFSVASLCVVVYGGTIDCATC